MTDSSLLSLLRCITLAVLAGCACGAQADPFVHMKLAAIPDGALETMRGGFDNGQGLRASFGIERSTAINGTLVFSQSVQIPDLSRITAEQASQLHSMLSSVTLVRNGPDNTFAPVAPYTLGGATVVQNTLDGQAIKSLTVINATSNSLGALQAMNAAASLRNALIAPIVPRP